MSDGTMRLTAREVVILLYWLETGSPQDPLAAATLTPLATVEISEQRARQIRSKLMSRMRGAAGQGPYGPYVRDAYENVIRTSLRRLLDFKARHPHA